MRKRFYGEKINFKSLACAPVNEHGVVYLFGVLHEAFGFKIESVQAGFPDCIARRKVSKDKWEEVRIEFEFESRSFVAHKHDIKGVDMIICWRHNWKDCPKEIEVIELSEMIKDLESINNTVKQDTQQLSKYNLFCQEKRLLGLSFKEIAKLWNEQKTSGNKSKTAAKVKPSITYKEFLKQKISEGNTMAEAAKLWSGMKNKYS